MDGTVAAYRLPYLLAADSVVLKQEAKYYEHFYKDVSLPSFHLQQRVVILVIIILAETFRAFHSCEARLE